MLIIYNAKKFKIGSSYNPLGRAILVRSLYNEAVKFRSNIAIFILFFGIALVEAFQVKNWLLALLFSLLGAIFFWADNVKKRDR